MIIGGVVITLSRLVTKESSPWRETLELSYPHHPSLSFSYSLRPCQPQPQSSIDLTKAGRPFVQPGSFSNTKPLDFRPDSAGSARYNYSPGQNSQTTHIPPSTKHQEESVCDTNPAKVPNTNAGESMLEKLRYYSQHPDERYRKIQARDPTYRQ